MLNEQLALAVSSGSTVCAYVPVGTEPGSVELLDMLLQPLAAGAVAGCAHHRRRHCRCGCGGANTGRANSSAATGDCSSRPSRGCRSRLWPRPRLVVVPALAVDRRGVRLGRGGGFYDRSLDDRNPHARLIAMVRDVEFVDELPADPHDVPMTHVITPQRGVVQLRAHDGARE